MHCRACEFVTERLLVKEWHSVTPTDWVEQDLAEVVQAILTDPVTRPLPPSWRGVYSDSRAQAWVRERDDEGTTLLAIERATRRPVGLVILFETAAEEASGTEVRLGYLLAESAWSRGFGTELVAGLVQWCREHPEIVSMAGGVERNNPASRRVLEKNGFVADEGTTGEQLFRLTL